MYIYIKIIIDVYLFAINYCKTNCLYCIVVIGIFHDLV